MENEGGEEFRGGEIKSKFQYLNLFICFRSLFGEH